MLQNSIYWFSFSFNFKIFSLLFEVFLSLTYSFSIVGIIYCLHITCNSVFVVFSFSQLFFSSFSLPVKEGNFFTVIFDSVQVLLVSVAVVVAVGCNCVGYCSDTKPLNFSIHNSFGNRIWRKKEKEMKILWFCKRRNFFCERRRGVRKELLERKSGMVMWNEN